MSWQLLLATAVQFGLPFLIIFVYVVAVMLPLMIYMERKVCAYVQDRRGPNRAAVLGIRAFGLVHLFADVLKLLFKEDVEPTAAKRTMFRMAPLIVMATVLVIMAAVPFGEPIELDGFLASDTFPGYDLIINLQVINLNAGILFVFAIASLEVYGVILGGWASGNKYSFLGSLRGAAQMVSYEVTLGLAVLGILMVYGTADLYQLVMNQSENPLLWGLAISPIGFVLFLTAIFAETNRTPFDLPEAESEVVAGYHLEYSSFKFALFFMGEYVSMVVSAAVLVTLFLGGWQVPFVTSQMLEESAPFVAQVLCFGGAAALLFAMLGTMNAARNPRRVFGDSRDREPKVFTVLFLFGAVALAGAAIWLGTATFPNWASVTTRVGVQAMAFMGKTFFFSFFFIWVRWTLPRFRYDQLMKVGWQWMMPIGLANVLITYLWPYVWVPLVGKIFELREEILGPFEVWL
jgi:NADH-quinone oxidoreductase subunit H